MSKIKDNLLKLLNKIFSKKVKTLPPSQSETILNELKNSGIIKDFERYINNGINISKLDAFYGKKLGNEKSIYNMPLTSRLSENQTIELAKKFFSTLSSELSNKANQVIDGNSNKFTFIFEEYGKSLDKFGNPREAEVSNFSEVYCPKHGDLRDLYGIVHEVTHTFDLENGDTEARKVFGEIAPQYMERLLDNFLLQLSNDDLQMQLSMPEIVNNIKVTHNQLVLQEKLQDMLAKSRNGKNFTETLGNQNIHINLESKIPFVLITSSTFKNTQTLIMESNNLETNNMQNLLSQALDTGKDLNDIFHGNNPILIPILPSLSPTAPYYQQLSTECFQNGERPDLDIVEAIIKPKEIMKNQYNVKLNDKIFLNGYSSSRCFAQRFSLIHPELIDTACIGGASGSIPIPNAELDYPLGIRNYEELFGKKFNMKEYKQITFDYYVGNLECETKSLDRTDENGNLAPMHDMSYFDRSVPTDVGKAHRKNLGQDMFERAKKTVEILRDMGINISHIIIPNIAHYAREAFELAQKNPSNKNARGIRSVQGQIIHSSFNKMIQRDINRKNNYTLNEHS